MSLILFRRLRYAFGTVADHNRGEMIFGSLELMEWPVMHDLVARYTCALRRILSRDTPIAEGNPYLSQVWNPFPLRALRFDCDQLCGNVRCKHSCYILYLL